MFAIVPIPRGTNVFANDEAEIIWMSAADLSKAVPPEHLQLYHDFAIRRGSLLGCPKNFNSLTVGWYVNEPGAGDEANLAIGEDFSMHAVRDIAVGEELTIVYATFSARMDAPA